MPHRRLLLRLGLAASGAVLAPRIVRADGYPSRPVRIVVPWPAGHTADLVARLLAPRLQAALGQSFYVDNVGGAAGAIGLTQMKNAPADGTQILLTSGGPVVLAPLFTKDIAYDPVKDYAPVAPIGWFGSILVTRPDFPANSVPELVAYLRAHPGKVSFSSTGVTSFNRLLMEMLMHLTGTRMTHVPYRGEADQLGALMAGTVDIAFSGMGASTPVVQAKKLKGLAVALPARSPLVPALPTFKEAGTPELEHFVDLGTLTWIGVLVPAKTPAPVVATLNRAVTQIIKTPGFRAELTRQGVDPSQPYAPAEFGKAIVDNIALWKKVIADAHVTAE
ncbi:MAG: tripartite tricarboxylate transporter substrate binding protein [Proteobacteria bacterium]|nr:tripartite tricarboxylate transporter substrate binding protein [Pseudomonadota bacterium]